MCDVITNYISIHLLHYFMSSLQVLLLVDASFGFEMETFELLNILQTHGFPKVIGVLTHLDLFKHSKSLKKTKKRLKQRFWTEVYQVVIDHMMHLVDHMMHMLPSCCLREQSCSTCPGWFMVIILKLMYTIWQGLYQ